MIVKTVPIGAIKPYDKNPRNNEAAVDKVAASIKEFGFKQPIVVDKDGIIIAGHTRLKAAQKLGIKEVPVIYADDLTDEQVKAYRLADNKTAEFAEWDADLLGEELTGLAEIGFDMEPFGFEPEKDLEEIIEDEAPEPPEVPTAKLGDIWQLGRHRLMCGDSTDLTTVELLMDGKKADMVFTDPPYNVNYEGGTSDKLTIQNDKMGNDAFYQFLFDSFYNMAAVTEEGGAIYICHSDTEGINFRNAMVSAGWLHKQCLVWAKNSLVLGRQDYHWKHEPILYGWKPGRAHYWHGGRKQSTVIEDYAAVVVRKDGAHTLLTFVDGLKTLTIKVPSYEVVRVGDDSDTTIWRIEKPLRNGEHPTMKPVNIPARAIQNSCKPGGIVIDLFGGSGTTIIAAEQTSRICYMMELDPKYCDVIVQRWENLTGQKAKLLESDGAEN